MSDGNNNHSSRIKNIEEQAARKRSLAAALVEVKNRQASRDDVVVDMKEAELARLELLAEELRPIFEELPTDNIQFEYAISRGKPPRFWIDMTSHVSMGHDKRTYRFLKDTRAGRTVIAESNNLTLVADAVSNYVAEKVLEHEKILEGEWTTLQLVEETAIKKQRTSRQNTWMNFLWFVIGFGTSLGLLYVWVNYRVELSSLIN